MNTTELRLQAIEWISEAIGDRAFYVAAWHHVNGEVGWHSYEEFSIAVKIGCKWFEAEKETPEECLKHLKMCIPAIKLHCGVRQVPEFDPIALGA